MTIHGTCLTCGRIARVRVTGAALARLAQRSTPTGQCLDCEFAAIEAARQRHPSSRR